MAIDINQFNAPAMAAAAGQSVPNLGLKPVGLTAQDVLQGLLQQAQIKEEYSNQQNQIRVQQLQNQGLLNKAQAEAVYAANLKAVELQTQKDIANAHDQVQLFIGNNNAAYQQGTLGINQQNANSRAQEVLQNGLLGQGNLNATIQNNLAQQSAKQQDLGIQQQQANQLGQYQQGQLAIGQGNMQANQSKANTEKFQAMFNDQMQLNNRDLTNQARILSGLQQNRAVGLTGQQLTDADNSVYQYALQHGVDPNTIAQLQNQNPQQLMNTIHAGLAVNSMVQQAKNNNISTSLDQNGNLQFKQIQPQSPQDKSIMDQNAQLYGKGMGAMQSANAFGEKVNEVANFANQMPDSLTGPFNQYLAEHKQQGQELQARLQDLGVSAAAMMASQGKGMRLNGTLLNTMNTINGGLQDYKGSLQDLLNRAQALSNYAGASAWNQTHNALQGSSLQQSWEQQHPEPTIRVLNKSQVQAVQNGQLPLNQADQLSIPASEYFPQEQQVQQNYELF